MQADEEESRPDDRRQDDGDAHLFEDDGEQEGDRVQAGAQDHEMGVRVGLDEGSRDAVLRAPVKSVDASPPRDCGRESHVGGTPPRPLSPLRPGYHE